MQYPNFFGIGFVDVGYAQTPTHTREGTTGDQGFLNRQLFGLFGLLNLSLAQTTVPTIFKTSTIVPVPKHSTASVPNDFRFPVALTPIIAKCFERLVASHLKSCLPATLDPIQFAYRRNRSTEDAISTALHSALTHLDSQNTHVRMLFIDFSSAFNTVIPSKLISKLSQLGISTSICNWILDFLTNRPQSVKLDNLSSSTITLNTGVPQGCVLSPLLYSLFTHNCVPVYGSNTIIKFTDDTTVVGLIKDDDESAYRDEVQHLAVWCATNNLELNTQKTKEIIVDFRRTRSHAHTPIYINGAVVERVEFQVLWHPHLWSHNTSTLVKKAQQHLHFLRSLKKVHLNPRILVEFYRCTIESILTNCISVWYSNCSASDHKALQRMVKTAQRITGTQLTSTENIYHKRCLGRARDIIKDASHPNHGLFTLLPSGRRYRSLRSRTSRLRKSFFPEAVTLLNATPPI
uniref:Reverse transcriptase domain-containing protein n=2 Tax=Cyprinus carpio carpio TaxID=630221 RepID=A0A9J8C8P2_CYPCA